MGFQTDQLFIMILFDVNLLKCKTENQLKSDNPAHFSPAEATRINFARRIGTVTWQGVAYWVRPSLDFGKKPRPVAYATHLARSMPHAPCTVDAGKYSP